MSTRQYVSNKMNFNVEMYKMRMQEPIRDTLEEYCIFTNAVLT
jgi:hypothetical protein